MLLVLCLRWKGQWHTTVMSLTQLVHPAPLYCQTVDSGYITEVDAIVSVFAMLQPFAHSYYCPGVMQFSFLLMLSQKADEKERPQVKQKRLINRHRPIRPGKCHTRRRRRRYLGIGKRKRQCNRSRKSKNICPRKWKCKHTTPRNHARRHHLSGSNERDVAPATALRYV